MATQTKIRYKVTDYSCRWSATFKTLEEARECVKYDPMFKQYPETGKSFIEKITTTTTRVR
jgi:phosphotransferase system IIB component